MICRTMCDRGQTRALSKVPEAVHASRQTCPVEVRSQSVARLPAPPPYLHRRGILEITPLSPTLAMDRRT